MAGVPFIFRTAQSYVKNYPFPFSYFEKKVREWKVGWVAGGKTVFEAMKKRGLEEDRGEIISLSVDTKKFKPISAGQREEVLKRLGLQAPVIGMLGRITEAKGITVLMQALDRLGGERPWNLLLMGSGDNAKIESWATERGWNNRVKIKLFSHEEVPSVLPAMDLLVAPSQTMPNWREQFGRMLVEAFACGVPVVGSSSGEIPFVIGEAGLVVDESDVDAWSEAIGRVLQDKVLHGDMVSKGLERARYFSSEQVAQRYKLFYRKTLSQ